MTEKLVKDLLKKRIVYILDEINKESVKFIHSALLDLDQTSHREIKVWFTSQGGLADASHIIYDTIRHLQSPTVGVVFNAASGACTILQACGKRQIVKSGKIFIHSPKCSPDFTINKTLDEQYEVFKRQNLSTRKRLLEILKSRSKLSNAKLEELLRLGDIHSEPIYAERAIELGLVDEIVPDNFRIYNPTVT